MIAVAMKVFSSVSIQDLYQYSNVCRPISSLSLRCLIVIVLSSLIYSGIYVPATSVRNIYTFAIK